TRETLLLRLMGAGRTLREDDPDNHLVINETAMRTYGFGSPEAAIGKIIAEKMGPGEPDKSFHIVGVASDFHTMDFSQEIHPAMFMLEQEEASTINVKPAGDSPAGWKSALQKIEAEWSKIYPGEEFSGKFYDETLEEIYEADMRLGYFINFATLVAIFISCLGLFGLSTFMAWRRTKEIGIRKVLGASVSRLVGLLSREFMLLVLLGFLPAVPVALYFLRRWLQEYAYRIELQWWMFAAAAAVALFIAFLTVSVQSMRAALSDPVKSLRSE
ncbi:MAG TPA: FtsX-like permease family protein, partial [Saprospiraceae bacterium]|nr:FtsX-like permease family protein [Saprospiraceae bacterium]